jgi:hypothetical protein
MTRSTLSRISRVAVLTTITAAAVLGTTTAAQAAAGTTVVLKPGQQACVQQYASYQVRGDGWATGQGAKFKLTRNGQVINGSPGLVTNWAAEARTAYGTFPGPGTYTVCATNNGTTTNTTATIQIRTDSEI